MFVPVNSDPFRGYCTLLMILLLMSSNTKINKVRLDAIGLGTLPVLCEAVLRVNGICSCYAKPYCECMVYVEHDVPAVQRCAHHIGSHCRPCASLLATSLHLLKSRQSTLAKTARPYPPVYMKFFLN